MLLHLFLPFYNRIKTLQQTQFFIVHFGPVTANLAISTLLLLFTSLQIASSVAWAYYILFPLFSEVSVAYKLGGTYSMALKKHLLCIICLPNTPGGVATRFYTR